MQHKQTPSNSIGTQRQVWINNYKLNQLFAVVSIRGLILSDNNGPNTNFVCIWALVPISQFCSALLNTGPYTFLSNFSLLKKERLVHIKTFKTSPVEFFKRCNVKHFFRNKRCDSWECNAQPIFFFLYFYIVFY